MLFVLIIGQVLINAALLLLAWKKDSDQLGKFKYYLPAVFILITIFAILTTYHQDVDSRETKMLNENLSEDIHNLEGRQVLLLEGNKLLLDKFDLLEADHDTLLSALEVSGRTPSVDTTLPVTPTEPVATSRLVEVVKRRSIQIDRQSGLVHTKLIFQSRNIVPLRDIQIELVFDKPVFEVNPIIIGAFVIEQGTRDTLIDHNSYIYWTGYLSQSNDIVIDILSKDSVKITTILSP